MPVTKNSYRAVTLSISLVVIIQDQAAAQWERVVSPTVSMTGQIAAAGTSTYAISGSHDVARSTDRGVTWKIIANFPTGDVKSIAVAGDTILVGNTYGIIERSTDDGITWTRLKKQFVETSQYWIAYYTLTHLVIRGSKYYAGVDGKGFFESTDCGETWSPRDNGFTRTPMGFFTYGMHLHGIAPVSIVRFEDDGSCTFKGSKLAEWGTLIRAVVATPSSIIATASSMGIQISTDGGDTWSCPDEATKSETITSLAAEGDFVVAGTRFNGLLMSSDGGKTWARGSTPNSIGWVTSVWIVDGDVFLALEGTALYRSTDRCRTWREVVLGRRPVSFRKLQTLGSTVIGMTYGAGLWRSTDGGFTWRPSGDRSITDTFTHFFVIGPAIFANAFTMYVYRSVDSGATWVAWGKPPPSVVDFADLTAVHVLGDVAYVATRDKGLFRLADNARVWAVAGSGQLAKEVTSLTSADTILFAATGTVMRSADRGNTWSTAISGIEGSKIISLASSGKVVYCVDGNGRLFYSDNYGDSWKRSEQTEYVPQYPTMVADGDYMVAQSSYNVLNCSSTRGKIVKPFYLPWYLTSMAVMGGHLVVSTPDSGTFRYRLPPRPEINVVSPARASISETNTLVVEGEGFVPGNTSVLHDSVIIASEARVETGNRLLVSLHVSHTASPGLHDLVVMNFPGGGVDTLHDCITTEYARSHITGISLSAAKQGEQVGVWVGGSGFAANGTTVDFGEGIKVTNVRIQSNTTIGLTLIISPGATPGPRKVVVSNATPGGGSDTLGLPFTVIGSSTMERLSASVPSEFRLLNAYPNPFNPSTRIRFELAEWSHVRLEVYNALGSLVRILDESDRYGGSYALNWHASGFPSGLYFIRLRASSLGSSRQLDGTQRVLLLK